jgi:hypothetical protein
MIRNAIRTIAFPILLWLLPNGSVLAQATSSIKCSDGGTYTVSTGTNQGHCVGSKDVVVCEDGKGNKSSTSCVNGCGDTDGAATCVATKGTGTGNPSRKKTGVAPPPAGMKPPAR